MNQCACALSARSGRLARKKEMAFNLCRGNCFSFLKFKLGLDCIGYIVQLVMMFGVIK